MNKESCANIAIADTSTDTISKNGGDAIFLYTQQVLNATLKKNYQYHRDSLKVLNSFKPKGLSPGAVMNNSVLIRFGDDHGEILLLPVVSKARKVGADNEKGTAGFRLRPIPVDSTELRILRI